MTEHAQTASDAENSFIVPQRKLWIGWCALLVLAAIAYLPGLRGGFLFDDYPNLTRLADWGGVRDWETFKLYIASGFSGPTGRPISLASFLIDAQNWPANPAPFKRTNLILHLLTATVLWQATRLLLASFTKYALNKRQLEIIAMLAAAIWLLHPFMLSTTLYIVQRMAILSALFSLLGLSGYLYGRSLLASAKTHAYLWMTISIGAGTVFAVFSKENGALLPLLIGVVEWVLRAQKDVPSPDKRWVFTCIVAPSLLFLGYLVSLFDFSGQAWLNRPYTQSERLWTQPRIIFEYMGNLFFPRIEGNGLIQDDYVFSTSALNPPSTLIALFGLVLLIAFIIFARRRLPLASVSLGFFLVGHLMESTWLNLELYFEHRNYLPAAFIFLPVVAAAACVLARFRPFFARTITVLGIFLLAFLLHQRALLWSDTAHLEDYWATNRPYSVRAHNHWVVKMFEAGDYAQAQVYLEDAVQKVPDSAVLKLLLLYIKMTGEVASQKDFDELESLIGDARIDAQVMTGLHETAAQAMRMQQARGRKDYVSSFLEVINGVSANAAYERSESLRWRMTRIKISLLMSLEQWDAAMRQVDYAFEGLDDVDAALQIVDEVAAASRYQDALSLIPRVKAILAELPKEKLRRSLEEYNNEITGRELLIQQNIIKEQGVDADGS